MTQFIKKQDTPSILLDNTRNCTLVAMEGIEDSQLLAELKVYRCNTQVAAMMANVGDIYKIPENVHSKFAGKPLKISLFDAWNEVYHAALTEYESRQRRPKLF